MDDINGINDIDNSNAGICEKSGKREEKAKKAAFLKKLLSLRFEDSFSFKMRVTSPENSECTCNDDRGDRECVSAYLDCSSTDEKAPCACTEEARGVCFEKSLGGSTSCNLAKAAVMLFSAVSACALLCAVCNKIKK